MNVAQRVWDRNPDGLFIPEDLDALGAVVLAHATEDMALVKKHFGRKIMGGARGVYTVSFQNITANNADGNHDWFEIDPAADKPVEIIGLFLGQSSDFGDSQEEILRTSIVYMSGGTFTSGGEVSTTPRPTDPSDGAASGAYEAFNSNGTAASTSGTSVIRHADSFNVRSGLQYILPPDLRHKCDGAAQSALLVRNDSTVADDIVFDGCVYVREI